MVYTAPMISVSSWADCDDDDDDFMTETPEVTQVRAARPTRRCPLTRPVVSGAAAKQQPVEVQAVCPATPSRALARLLTRVLPGKSIEFFWGGAGVGVSVPAVSPCPPTCMSISRRLPPSGPRGIRCAAHHSFTTRGLLIVRVLTSPAAAAPCVRCLLPALGWRWAPGDGSPLRSTSSEVARTRSWVSPADG